LFAIYFFLQIRHCRSLAREARVSRKPLPPEALSPERELPPEIHREKFHSMRAGLVEEGEAVLRMKVSSGSIEALLRLY
jgi:hypothetical protein